MATDERPAPVGGVREAWVGRPPTLGPHGPILEDPSLSRGLSDSHGPGAVGSAWEVRSVLEEGRPPGTPRACEVGQVRPRELHGVLRPGQSGAADLDPGAGTLQPQDSFPFLKMFYIFKWLGKNRKNLISLFSVRKFCSVGTQAPPLGHVLPMWL